MNSEGVKPNWDLFVGLCITFVAIVVNLPFIHHVSKPEMFKMADVPEIFSGFYNIHSVTDTLQWWHGSWIHQGTGALRPVSSYLYWFDCLLGLQYGFFWVGCVGLALLLLNCFWVHRLAYQFTENQSLAAFAGFLAACLPYFNFVPSTPEYWLVWFPAHDTLLCSVFLLAGLSYYADWAKSNEKKALVFAWGFWITASLTKEYAYIFPMFACAVILQCNLKPRRLALIHILFMLVFIVGLFIYRHAVILHPRDPVYKATMFLRKPFLYLAYPFYKQVLTEDYWIPGLAVLLFCLIGGLLKLARGKYSSFLRKQFITSATCFFFMLIVGLYCQIANGSWVLAMWDLFDHSALRGRQLCSMVATIYAFWLAYKYRNELPTTLVLTLMILSYVPVIAYLGWHYTIISWFVRCFYWAVIGKAALRDIGGFKPFRTSNRTKFEPSPALQ